MIFDVLRIVECKKPDLVLLENVPGLESTGKVLEIIKQKFEDLGYAVSYSHIDAVNLVPQFRHRIYFVCFKDKALLESWVWPTLPELNRSVKEVIEVGLSDPSIFTLTESQWQKRLDIADKQKFLIDDSLPTCTLTRNLKRAPGKNSGKKFASNQKFNGWHNLVPQVNSECPRYFTPRECARLQGFPESYKLLHEFTADTGVPAYFGNAVCPPVIAIFAGPALLHCNLYKKDLPSAQNIVLDMLLDALPPSSTYRKDIETKFRRGRGTISPKRRKSATNVDVSTAYRPDESVTPTKNDAFREVEQSLRGKTLLKQLSDVPDTILDIRRGSDFTSIVDKIVQPGVLHLSWEGSLPGIFYLPNRIAEKTQTALANDILNKWLEPPNKSNLTPQGIDNFWDCGPNDSINKLRWVTLGYQYDWGLREYEKVQTAAVPFPLIEICKSVAKSCNISEELVVDAGIINLYHAKRTSDRLGGHKDDAEPDCVSPLVSISLGLPGVFLLGGDSREVRPKILILRAGDVLVLSGAARQAYHGVPVILSKPDYVRDESLFREAYKKISNGVPPPKAMDFENVNLGVVSDMAKQDVNAFLKKTRINLSMRRV